MSASQIIKNGELFIKDINISGNLKINNNIIDLTNLSNPTEIITEQQNQITALQNQIAQLNAYITELKRFMGAFKESVYIDDNGQEYNYEGLLE